MVELYLVGFDPVVQLVDSHTLVALVCHAVHEKAVARRRRQGIHDVDLAVGVFLAQLLCGDACRVVGARYARRQADVEHVFALFGVALEDGSVLLDVDLRGARVCAVDHGLVEVCVGDGLAQVVVVMLLIQEEMEGNPVDVALGKVLGAQVCSRAARDDVFGQGALPVVCPLALRVADKTDTCA